MISVDAKKKEQVGLVPMAGREWRPSGQPIQVEDHSFFAGPRVDTVIPYGIYDMTANTGWVNVGLDRDTAAFAAASVRAWWRARGRLGYPQATRLLITADAGGSNSYRCRPWKAELAAFAAEARLTVAVCHFPPGTSKAPAHAERMDHLPVSGLVTEDKSRAPSVTNSTECCGLARSHENKNIGSNGCRRKSVEVPIAFFRDPI
ncbi:hypothetical protein Asi03nite_67020 [Actinoplanes siamensis]|uniref:Transposase n=1 Tax=Actinoplanes siamensis TaxID=1223317 RepID=A0A919NEC3_9ACTN|nr:hypothetical protein Asi03nite_67020 [Actinoplanes siamensis]